MNWKRKVGLFFLLVILLVISSLVFQEYSGRIVLYDNLFYYYYQNFRLILLGFLPISIGDALYILGGAMLLLTLAKWVKFIIRLRQFKWQLLASILRLVNIVLFVYLLFIWGWGANYYKPSLSKSWDLEDTIWSHSSNNKVRFRKDSAALVVFDSLLVTRLNEYAPHFKSLPFKEINNRAISFYRQYTDSRVKQYGLGIKPTYFWYFMERLGVEGYYNPFTGEGQIDAHLPGFTMPFLLCHEMAHQAGIAAENDANLLAYAICSTTADSTFRYSGYLNMWLYVHRRVYHRDTIVANALEARLNPLTTTHIDTLEQLSRKFNNEAAEYSTELYDDYLKMHNQQQGIKSYGNVVGAAWQLELRRRKLVDSVIRIP